MQKKEEINNKFLEDISILISNNSANKIKELISDLHIADIAEVIEELPIHQSNYLFQLLEEEKSAVVLMELEEDVREHLLSLLSSKEIATEVIDNLESDDAISDVISELPEQTERRSAFLN